MNKREALALAGRRDLPDFIVRAVCRIVGRKPAKSIAKAQPTRRAEKAAARGERGRRIGEIREAVFARAQGQCEARLADASRCIASASVLDHWEGGVGRRRQRESVASCWALCAGHDAHRTANYPDAAWWNRSRAIFCAAMGLPFVAHLEKRPLGPTRTECRPAR